MKKLKKLVAMLLTACMIFAMTACGEGTTSSTGAGNTDSASTTIKAGFICLHDENSTYDLNFINAAKKTCEEMGISYIIKTGIPEGQECYEAACELVDEGCNFIFADSFGHEDYMIEAAKTYPEVQFAHATGTKAHTAGLSNFQNAFANIFEGRYLAGIVAGMKLNEMIDAGQITADQAKVGYVGAFTYAEVISGYTSFFLGIRSVCPSATMEVTFTGSWYDEAMEKEGANTLIQDGCVLISQHADSMGAPTACETAGVPNVSYNGSTVAACPNTFLVSSRIDWAPYFKHCFECIQTGADIENDWCGTMQQGSVVLTDYGTAIAAGTQEAVDAAKAALADGSLHVFDINTFTVGGAKLDSYSADVDSDEAFTPDHEVIVDGYFDESGKNFRSAPFFDLQIDGITLLDSKF